MRAPTGRVKPNILGITTGVHVPDLPVGRLVSVSQLEDGGWRIAWSDRLLVLGRGAVGFVREGDLYALDWHQSIKEVPNEFGKGKTCVLGGAPNEFGCRVSCANPDWRLESLGH